MARAQNFLKKKVKSDFTPVNINFKSIQFDTTEQRDCPMRDKQLGKLDGALGGFDGGPAYTWEQCGNLCYLDLTCAAWKWTPPTRCWLWTWTDEHLLYAQDFSGTISGYRECPGAVI